MQIWPAIDLLEGKCVRLQQGDYSKNTVFSVDPKDTAMRWFDQGATSLHCVDLDGAKSGSIINSSAIELIVEAAAGRPVQLGGGVRDEKTIQRLLSLGLSRLVVGTAALRKPDWFAEMCDRYRGHIVLGLDARDGMVATQGWQETSSTLAGDLVLSVAKKTGACVAVVYTDIAKDGMMSGPNFSALSLLQKSSPFPVVASGGITTLQDVERLVSMDTAECIIGRTLYEGRIALKDALRIANAKPNLQD